MLFKHSILLLLTATPVLWCPRMAMAQQLQAGAARIDITPPIELKASLGGYGDRMSRPAEGIHDRLFAKAVVFSDGSRQFAMVTADILGFPPSFKKEIISKLADDRWTGSQIMLLPSHSHTAIDMMQIHPGNLLPIPQIGIFHPQLFKRTAKKLVEVIRQAQTNIAPIQVGTIAEELAGWNANRRTDNGPVDRQLTVTRISTLDDQPLVALVHWTAHPTFMAPEDMWYSAGWPGHMQRTLESLIGDGVTVMYYNGAEGDQRPVAREGSGESRWERAERYGRELAIKCHRLWNQVELNRDVPFFHHQQPITLPKPTAHPDFMRSGGAEYGLNDGVISTLLSSIVPPTTSSTSLRIGELVIVGIPGEMSAELGLDIKAATRKITGTQYQVIGGLADEWISYILTADEYQKGGYESSVSFFGPTLGSVIRNSAVEGVKEMAETATNKE